MLNVRRSAFIVNAPRAAAWEHVTQLAAWPTWASQVRAVDVEPDGELAPGTRCHVRYRSGLRATYEIVEVVPGQSFTWTGKLLWLRSHCRHLFEDAPDHATRLTFETELRGVGARLIGPIVAAICGANVQRSIPRLVMEINAYKSPDPVAAYRAVMAG
jgi:uncharacterized membrane protein